MALSYESEELRQIPSEKTKFSPVNFLTEFSYCKQSDFVITVPNVCFLRPVIHLVDNSATRHNIVPI